MNTVVGAGTFPTTSRSPSIRYGQERGALQGDDAAVLNADLIRIANAEARMAAVENARR
jgi:hypothetical protein